MSTELEGQVWKAVSLCAVNAVLSVPSLLGTDLLVQELSKGGWQGNEGSASVEDGASVLHVGLLLSELDRVELNLPVSLSAEWDLDKLARVVRLVDTAKDDLRLVVSVTKIESEDSLVELALVDQVVEWWDNSVDGDGVVSETQDTIEAAEGESETWLLGSLSEILLLDGEVTDVEGVLGDETAQATRAVDNLEAGTVALVGAGSIGIIGLVKVASNGATLLGWNPDCFSVSSLLMILPSLTSGLRFTHDWRSRYPRQP